MTTEKRTSEDKPAGDDGALAHAEDAVANHDAVGVVAVRLALGRERDVVADAGILIDDGALDPAGPADADRRTPLLLVGLHLRLRLVIVGAHHDNVLEIRVLAEDGADADDAMPQRRVGHKTAVADDHVVDVAAVG